MDASGNSFDQSETTAGTPYKIEVDKIPFYELGVGKFKCGLCSKVLHYILLNAHSFSHSSGHWKPSHPSENKANQAKDTPVEKLPPKEKIQAFKNSFVTDLPLKEKVIKIGNDAEQKSKEISKNEFIKTLNENAAKTFKADIEKKASLAEASIQNPQKHIKKDTEKKPNIENPSRVAKKQIKADTEKRSNPTEAQIPSVSAQIGNGNTLKPQNNANSNLKLASKLAQTNPHSKVDQILETVKNNKKGERVNSLSQVISQALNLQPELPMKRQRSFGSVSELLKTANICGIIINRFARISSRVIYISQLHSFRVWKNIKNNKFY